EHALPDFYTYTLGYAVQPLLIAGLIVQLIGCAGSGAWRWFDSAPMRSLGRISYSLYLYHVIVLMLVKRALGDGPTLVRLPVAVAITVAVAALSYHAVEKPLLRWREKRFERRVACYL
ncbi:MAG: acyltransferase family protein, partial [Bryobacteraceae bacterium]